jgi:hypothetical protein
VANLKHGEKRDLEEFLEMRTGYVLDFSNRTCQEFVLDSTGLDIDDESVGGSGSKANRLRYFWENQPNNIVGKLLRDFVGYRGNASPLREKCALIAERLIQSGRATTRRYYTARNQRAAPPFAVFEGWEPPGHTRPFQ